MQRLPLAWPRKLMAVRKLVSFWGIILVLLMGGLLPTRAIAQPATPAPEEPVFNSIIIDFQESPGFDISQIFESWRNEYSLVSEFASEAYLNSEFSEEDNVYVVPGGQAVLDQFLQSQLLQETEYIEPNYIYTTAFQSPPNDPDYSKQWNFNSINIETAWEVTRGAGATVAVIDTGVTQVPDLEQTQFVPGYDFVNDRVDARDDNGHGTHVAGTIAQSTNNGYGVAGIAPEAKIMPLKVLARSGGGTTADIAEAVKFAADHGADVINMSLGGGPRSRLFEEAIAYAHNKGVVIVAAAGNNNRAPAEFPARYEHVIGVSAVGPDGRITPYSNYGDGVDIAAPGGWTGGERGQAGGILQETVGRGGNGSTFQYFQGTSMASPHVAGVAAALKSLGVTEPDRVESILRETARRVDQDSRNFYGAGLLDAGAAVLAIGVPELPVAGLSWQMALVFVSVAIAFTLILWRVNRFPLKPGYWLGLWLGTVAFFPLQWLAGYSFVPAWLAMIIGSSIPGLGSALTGPSVLNPITASVLIPFGLTILLLGSRGAKWFAIGVTVGTAAVLAVSLFSGVTVMWLNGLFGWLFLLLNVILCLGLAQIAARVAVKRDKLA